MEEGLSHSIKATIANGSLKGFSLHVVHPPIPHSQIVVDTMLLGTPTVREAYYLQRILIDFSDALGTLVNIYKSQILFFNTPRAIQSHVSRLLVFFQSSLLSKYLGIPLINNAL